jgi:hypothetical protein
MSESLNMTRGEGRSHSEETTMWPTWNTLPVGWTDVMLVVLVSVAACVSACTTPGLIGLNPSAPFPDGGYTGPAVQGNDDSSLSG